jgi:hypothetical protein
LDDDASALSAIIDLSRNYGTGAVDFDVTLEELHEDRSAVDWTEVDRKPENARNVPQLWAWV